MPLPDLIEIVPLTEPVRAEIIVPGSKSITNRALMLAALANGQVTLQGALWSEDTQVMVDCLQKLGFEVCVEQDPNEACNRTITMQGLGGRILNAGTVEKPLELFVGNAGTAARFLAALVCLGNGVYRLHGVPRMHERPQAALFQALRQLGYRVDSPNDKLPAVIHGGGPILAGSSRGNEAHSQTGNTERGMRSEDQSLLTSAATGGKRCRVSIAESCQFASALLLSAARGGWEVEIGDDDAQDLSYVRMTREMIKVFPHGGGSLQIEPDASSGSYFWSASSLEQLSSKMTSIAGGDEKGYVFDAQFKLTTTVACWPTSGWQIDERFALHVIRFLPMGRSWESLLDSAKQATAQSFKEAALTVGLPTSVPAKIEKATPTACCRQWTISRKNDLGDSIMTAVVLAPLAEDACKFTDLGRLRIQECERVVALRTELTRCGAKVVEEGDTLTVHPSRLHGAEIETYNDHRMAMCFAILGLKVPGIKIKNPTCVKKTFPNFFQKLAAPPPRGLGVTLLDGHTGRRLEMEELFAD